LIPESSASFGLKIKIALIISLFFSLGEIIIALAHRVVISPFTLAIIWGLEFGLALIISLSTLLISLLLFSFWHSKNRLKQLLQSFQIIIVLISVPYFFSFYLLNTKALARLPHTGWQRLGFNFLFFFLVIISVVTMMIIFKRYRVKPQGLTFGAGCFFLQLLFPSIHFFFFSSVPAPSSPQERFYFLLALSLPFILAFWLISYIPFALKKSHFSKFLLAVLDLILVLFLFFLPPYFNYQRQSVSQLGAGGLVKGSMPNIIMVVWDTARRDRLSLYGHNRLTTPCLDAFASDALVFKNAYTVAPWTLPSHASMWTGLYPFEHQAENVEGKGKVARPLSSRALTLAEILKSKGYRTAAWTANHAVMNSWFGLDQGFDFYFDERPHLFDLLSVHLIARSSTNNLKKLMINTSYLSSEINKRMLPWLKKNAETPFFLFINYLDPHGVNYLPPPYRGKFGGRNRLPRIPYSRIVEGHESLDPRIYGQLLARHDEEIASCDSSFGELINVLKELNLYDHSLIIVLSDHGQLFGEHNLFGHRSFLYEEVIKIPLVIKFPRGYQPATDPEKPIENRQLFHLILDLLKISCPHGTPSLLSDHKGAIYTIAESFVPSSLAAALGISPDSRRFQENLFGPRVALIRHAGACPKLIFSATGRDELYLLNEDPHEKINQIENKKEIAVELRQVWFSWQSLWQKDTLSIATEKENMPNKALIERLRSLDYIR